MLWGLLGKKLANAQYFSHTASNQIIVHTEHAQLSINGTVVERMSSTKFLGVHISKDLLDQQQ